MKKSQNPARARLVERASLTAEQRNKIKASIVRPRHKPEQPEIDSFLHLVELALSTYEMEVTQLTELVDADNMAFLRTEEFISHMENALSHLEDAVRVIQRMDAKTESLIHQHYVVDQDAMLPLTEYGPSMPIEGFLRSIINSAREHQKHDLDPSSKLNPATRKNMPFLFKISVAWAKYFPSAALTHNDSAYLSTVSYLINSVIGDQDESCESLIKLAQKDSILDRAKVQADRWREIHESGK